MPLSARPTNIAAYVYWLWLRRSLSSDCVNALVISRSNSLGVWLGALVYLRPDTNAACTKLEKAASSFTSPLSACVQETIACLYALSREPGH